MFGSRRGVLSLLSLIYILWEGPSTVVVLHGGIVDCRGQILQLVKTCMFPSKLEASGFWGEQFVADIYEACFLDSKRY